MQTIANCRSCGSADLTDLFSLGEQYVSNFVNKVNITKGIKVPIELVLCEHCSLVQLRHTAPQDFLYSRYYWYRSGVTDFMKKALRDITCRIQSTIQLNSGDIVFNTRWDNFSFLLDSELQQLQVQIPQLYFSVRLSVPFQV